MKYCPGCKADKPDQDFYTEPRQSGGLSSYCKACKRLRNSRYWKEVYYPAHREAHIKNVQKRKQRNT